jgi:hypothetical protein
MAGYSGTPLARKLGIGPGAAVLLDGAPAGFSLGELPEQASVHRLGEREERAERAPQPRTAGVISTAGCYDVIVCFCPNAARLHSRWPRLHPLTTPAGALWVAWPKRSSGVTTDLDENVVRDYALTHGRVDVKVCAVDDVWSGLKHVIRKADR